MRPPQKPISLLTPVPAKSYGPVLALLPCYSPVFQKHTVPNLTVQLSREKEWRSLYPELKGPDVCLIYFGPDHDMGRFGYGIIAEQSMSKFLRRSSSSSSCVATRPRARAHSLICLQRDILYRTE